MLSLYTPEQTQLKEKRSKLEKEIKNTQKLRKFEEAIQHSPMMYDKIQAYTNAVITILEQTFNNNNPFILVYFAQYLMALRKCLNEMQRDIFDDVVMPLLASKDVVHHSYQLPGSPRLTPSVFSSETTSSTTSTKTSSIQTTPPSTLEIHQSMILTERQQLITLLDQLQTEYEGKAKKAPYNESYKTKLNFIEFFATVIKRAISEHTMIKNSEIKSFSDFVQLIKYCWLQNIVQAAQPDGYGLAAILKFVPNAVKSSETYSATFFRLKNYNEEHLSAGSLLRRLEQFGGGERPSWICDSPSSINSKSSDYDGIRKMRASTF